MRYRKKSDLQKTESGSTVVFHDKSRQRGLVQILVYFG